MPNDLYSLRLSYLLDPDGRLSYSAITYNLASSVTSPITGLVSYEVLSEVGALFESLGAVFEGVSQAPATLVALFPRPRGARNV